MPYPKKGECRNTGRTRFKKGDQFWLGKKRPNMTGKNHPRWKDKKSMCCNGYIKIWKPSHPNADARGYIKRAVLIMEQHLGRYLTSQEEIHHINNIKSDDRLQNLQLFPNKSEHMKLHHPKGSLWGKNQS